MIAGLLGVLKGNRYGKETYLQLFAMLYELFTLARREGLMRIENDIEKPETSPAFSKYSDFLVNTRAVEFLCDTLKVLVSGGVAPHDFEGLLGADLETHPEEQAKPVDALPGPRP